MLDIVELQGRIADVDGALTSAEKGQKFEYLVEYIFNHLDGVQVTGRDVVMASEEIDLVLWNAQTEEVLRPWESVILVECKNWTVPVGAPEFDSFIGKLRRRALKTGVFVAANGVTGDFTAATERGAVGIVRSALQEGIRVVVITLDDIRALTSLDDVRELIKKRYCGLYVHRVL